MRKSPSKPRGVALSDVLRQAPHLFSKQKVNAVDKLVRRLDQLPQPFQATQVVYLSKNCLVNLNGIDQFASMKVLSVADNLLPDYLLLQPLVHQCPSLEVLSLEGNPCAQLPHYRAHVVSMLPRLKVLDGRPISDSERSAANAAVEREEAVMGVMLSNACLVHKLAMVAQLVATHIELRGRVFQGRLAARLRSHLPCEITVDAQRLLKLWDYEAYLSPEERGMIRAALRREVSRAHRHLRKADPATKPTWDAAYAQVMLGQQQSITHLLAVLKYSEQEAQSQARDFFPVAMPAPQQASRGASPPPHRLVSGAQKSPSRRTVQNSGSVLAPRTSSLSIKSTASEVIRQPNFHDDVDHNSESLATPSSTAPYSETHNNTDVSSDSFQREHRLTAGTVSSSSASGTPTKQSSASAAANDLHSAEISLSNLPQVPQPTISSASVPPPQSAQHADDHPDPPPASTQHPSRQHSSIQQPQPLPDLTPATQKLQKAIQALRSLDPQLRTPSQSEHLSATPVTEPSMQGPSTNSQPFPGQPQQTPVSRQNTSSWPSQQHATDSQRNQSLLHQTSIQGDASNTSTTQPLQSQSTYPPPQHMSFPSTSPSPTGDLMPPTPAAAWPSLSTQTPSLHLTYPAPGSPTRSYSSTASAHLTLSVTPTDAPPTTPYTSTSTPASAPSISHTYSQPFTQLTPISQLPSHLTDTRSNASTANPPSWPPEDPKPSYNPHNPHIHAAFTPAQPAPAAPPSAYNLPQATLRLPPPRFSSPTTFPHQQQPGREASVSYNEGTGDWHLVTPLPGSPVRETSILNGMDGSQHIHVHLHQGPGTGALYTSLPSSPTAATPASPSRPSQRPTRARSSKHDSKWATQLQAAEEAFGVSNSMKPFSSSHRPASTPASHLADQINKLKSQLHDLSRDASRHDSKRVPDTEPAGDTQSCSASESEDASACSSHHSHPASQPDAKHSQPTRTQPSRSRAPFTPAESTRTTGESQQLQDTLQQLHALQSDAKSSRQQLHQQSVEAEAARLAAEKERDSCVKEVKLLREQVAGLQQEQQQLRMENQELQLRSQLAQQKMQAREEMVADAARQKQALQDDAEALLAERRKLLEQLDDAERAQLSLQRHLDDAKHDQLRQQRDKEEHAMLADRLQQRIAELESQLQRQQQQVVDAGREKAEMKKLLDDFESKVKMYRQQLVDSEQSRVAAEKQLHELKSDSHQQRSEFSNTFEELKSLSSTYNTLLEEFEKLQHEHQEAGRQLEQLQGELASSTGGAEGLRSAHRALTLQAEELQRQNIDLEHEVQHLRVSLETAVGEKRKVAAELRSCKDDLERAKGQSEHVTADAKQLKAKCTELQRQLEETEDKHRHAVRQVQHLQQSLHAAEEEKARQAKQLEQLQADHKHLRGDAEDLELELQRVRRAALDSEQNAAQALADCQDQLEERSAALAKARQQCEELLEQQVALQAEVDREKQVGHQLMDELHEQATVAQQVKGLRERVAELQAELATAHAHVEEGHTRVQHTERQLQRSNTELQNHRQDVVLKQQQEEASEELARRVMLRGSLRRWAVRATQNACRRERQHSALLWRRRSQLRKWMRSLRLAAVRSKAMQLLEARHCRRLLLVSMAALADNAAFQREKHRNEQTAMQHRNGLLLINAFQGWRQLAAAAVQCITEAPSAAATASVHFQQMLLLRGWTAWRGWFIRFQQPLLQRYKRAARMHRLFLLRRSIASWQRLMDVRTAQQAQLLRASCRRQAHLLSAAWGAWLRHLAFQHDSRRAESVAHHHLAARMLAAWRNVALRARLDQQKVTSFRVSRRTRLRAVALRAWKSYLSYQRRKALAQSLATQHHVICSLRSAFSMWRLHWRRAAAHSMQMKSQAQDSLQQVVERWRRVSAAVAEWDQTKKRAAALWRRKQLRLARLCFQEWHRAVRLEPQHRAPLQDALLVLCERRSLHKVFVAWYREAMETQHMRLQQLQSMAQALQASCRDLQAQLSGSEEARRQLQAEVQDLAERLSRTMDTSKEEGDMLQGQLQEALQREAQLGQEVDGLRQRLLAAEDTQQQLEEQLEQKALVEEGAAALGLRVQECEAEIGQLQEEVARKAATLADAVSSREATAAQYAQHLEASEQQLEELKEKLSDTRMALADKEEAALQLQKALRVADGDLEGTRERLGTTIKDASLQLQAREQRILGLEARVQELEGELTFCRVQHTGEVADFQDELERARSVIDKQRLIIKQAALFATPLSGGRSSSPVGSVIGAAYPSPGGRMGARGMAGRPEDGDGDGDESDQFPITAFVAQRAAALRKLESEF